MTQVLSIDVLTTDSLLLDNDKCILLSVIVAHVYADYFQWVMYDHSFRWNISCSPKWHLDYKFATPHIKPHAVAEHCNMLGKNKCNWFIRKWRPLFFPAVSKHCTRENCGISKKHSKQKAKFWRNSRIISASDIVRKCWFGWRPEPEYMHLSDIMRFIYYK